MSAPTSTTTLGALWPSGTSTGLGTGSA
jgi:hypothetical protein